MLIVKNIHTSSKHYEESGYGLDDLVTNLNQTPIFEWYVARCGSKNEYPVDMCLKESGLHTQNMITITKSTINTMNGDLYEHLMSTRIFPLRMVEDIHMSSKHY